MKQRLVFFSGMGADQRAFQYLQLDGTTCVYLNWIEPLEDEPLRKYALRLVNEVTILPTDVLIGLSMGGLVAQEVAAVFPVKAVILISSLRSGEILQPLFNSAQKLKLLKLVQKDILKKTIVNSAKIFLSKNDHRIQVIVDMLDQFSGSYYKWAMDAVLNWQGANTDCPVYHIHGSKDELFPIALVKHAEIIEGGSHLMVVTRPEEISTCILKFLAIQSEQG